MSSRYYIPFLIEILHNSDVDEKHNHNAGHLMFVCSFVFDEYLEHMHIRSRVHRTISDLSNKQHL